MGYSSAIFNILGKCDFQMKRINSANKQLSSRRFLTKIYLKNKYVPFTNTKF